MTLLNTQQPIPVLLCVSGMSPAIISETFYALAKRAQSPFIAQKVVVVTTAKGQQAIQAQLLNSHVFLAMCQQNNWPVPEWDIRTVKQNNIELDDIFNEEDFNCLADTVMSAIRDYTHTVPQSKADIKAKKTPQDQYRIHASLAGGRKTMSYYLGQAMNIFGRPQDRLSHVLLKEGYENQVANFYYPYQPQALLDKAGNPLILSACADDIVSLTEFPVISLKNQVNMARFDNQHLRFGQMLQAINDEQAGIVHPIQFSLGKYHTQNTGTVNFGYDAIELAPEFLAVLLWLAWRDHHQAPSVQLGLDAKAALLKQYYKQLAVVEYYVRYGAKESALKIEEMIKDEVFNNIDKIQKLIAPKLSDTYTKLKMVSSVYNIKPKRSHYALTAQILSHTDLQALNDFMMRFIDEDIK